VPSRDVRTSTSHNAALTNANIANAPLINTSAQHAAAIRTIHAGFERARCVPYNNARKHISTGCS